MTWENSTWEGNVLEPRPHCLPLCSNGQQEQSGVPNLLKGVSPSPFHPVWSLVSSLFSPHRAAFLVYWAMTQPQRGSWAAPTLFLDSLLSQASFLESGLLSLNLFPITRQVSLSPQDRRLPWPRQFSSQGSELQISPGLTGSRLGVLDVIHHEWPPLGFTHLLGCSGVSHALRLCLTKPEFPVTAAAWFPLSSFSLTPWDREIRPRPATSSPCIHPWILQALAESHGVTQATVMRELSHGICCSVDPCHKKNSQTWTIREISRSRAILSEIFQSKDN